MKMNDSRLPRAARKDIPWLIRSYLPIAMSALSIGESAARRKLAIKRERGGQWRLSRVY